MSLDLIRTKHSWFTKGILLLLAAAFIFSFGYGATSLRDLTSASGDTAAEVNGEEIPLTEFYRYRDNFKRQNPQIAQLSPAESERVNIRILNFMIDEKLLSQKARELGFRVPNQEVNEFIKSIPAFQNEGQFIGKKQYEERIRQIFNLNPGDFENILRQELLARKMEGFIYETALITEEELYNVYLRQNEKVNLYYIPFLSSEYIDTYTPSEEEITTYFEANKDKFKTDELRSIRYITITAENFENRIEISEEEINAYYNAYPEEFAAEDGSTQPIEEARAQILTVLKAQRGGTLREDFVEILQSEGGSDKSLDELAAEHKIETINESALFSQGDILKEIPPRITRLAFEDNKGDTAIVSMGTSLWVIEIKDIVPSKAMNIEEAREEVTAQLKNEKAKEITRKKAQETLAELKKAKKDELTEKTKSLGFELLETGYFSRLENVPNINNENLRSEAFEINEATVVSNKLYNNRDDFYIVSLKEKQSADKEVFNLEKDALKEQELIRQQSNLRQNWLQNLRRESKIIPNAALFPTQG
jgi:peptidyl-prolyl cis-trans isomerase D